MFKCAKSNTWTFLFVVAGGRNSRSETKLFCSFAKLRPLLHQLAPLLKQVGTPIRGLDAVRNRVRERLFNDVIRAVRFICRPIAEAGAEAVNGDAIASHAGQKLGQGAGTEEVGARAGKNNIILARQRS